MGLESQLAVATNSIEELERRLDTSNLQKHRQLTHLQAQLNDSKEREFSLQTNLTSSCQEALLQKTRADKLEVSSDKRN